MKSKQNPVGEMACTDTGHFSGWHPLNESALDEVLAPGAGAIQIRVAEGLVEYPLGKSAMVYFFFAANDARSAMRTLFDDELKRPGCRGLGALWFRYLQGPGAQERLEDRWAEFVARFGTPPIWHGE